MDSDLIPLTELMKKFPALSLGDLMKMYPPEALKKSIRQEIIAQEAVKERLLPRVKEIHAMPDDFTRTWLVDEFMFQHPEFTQSCASLEALKRLFVMVEENLKGK